MKNTRAQMVEFAAVNRRWLVCMSLFVLLWTLELYFVQAYTLIDPNGTGPRFAFWAPRIRLVFDFLFVSAMTLFLPRGLLAPVAVVTLLLDLVLVTYYHFFFRPLSILAVSNWREGMQVGQFAMDLFPKRKALMLACALVAKLGLLYFAGRPMLAWRDRWRVAAVFAAGYLALFVVTNNKHVDPLRAILTTRGVARLGLIRGYTGPWLAELYYLNDKEIKDRALYLLDNYTRDKLNPIEGRIPIGKRLVIVQAESFDFNILGFKANGQEVTPYMNGLRDKAMFYRIQASHVIGSGDADFATLNGVPPSPHVNNYLIPGYPYKKTLPQFLARYGFATYVFHGNSGQFYNRRAAFEKMGFAEINFREELQDRYHLPSDKFGWCRDDDVMMRASSLLLRQTQGPVCHFIITLTTHTPYIFLKPDQEEIFPGTSKTVERYINSMRYLDNCFRNYIESLPTGTTVLIYADHPTEVSGEGFQPDRVNGREYVPCYIYQKGADLSRRQLTRASPVSRDGSLNLLDVLKYLRVQVAAAYPPPADPEEKPRDKAEHQPADGGVDHAK